MATPLTGTPIPAYTAIPDVPADMTAALNNLEKYTVTRWATASARDAAITVPATGQLAFTTDTQTLWKWSGSAWVDVADRAMDMVQVTQTVSQSLTSGTFAPVTFTTELFKTKTGLHSTSSNTSRIIIGTVGGTWMMSGAVSFAGTSATGSRRVIMNLTGVNISSSYTNVPAGPTTGTNPFTTVVLTPQIISVSTGTDYVELQAYQDSGGALSTLVTGGVASTFAAVRLGP